MKYLGKLILEAVVITLIVGVVLFIIVTVYGEKIIKMLSG